MEPRGLPLGIKLESGAAPQSKHLFFLSIQEPVKADPRRNQHERLLGEKVRVVPT